jgi:hypothetical protein
LKSSAHYVRGRELDHSLLNSQNPLIAGFLVSGGNMSKPVGNPNLQKGGASLNPQGRPKETPEQKANKLKKSKLRKTEAELLKLNPDALANIAKSVRGEEIDKEVVNTSKWVVTTTVTVSKAAMSEELELNGLKDRDGAMAMADAQAEDDESATPDALFSLEQLPSRDHLRAVR